MKKVPAVNVIKPEHDGGQVKTGRVGQVKIKHNEIKSEQRKVTEKVTGKSTTMDDRTTADSLSDVSNDQDYEDDFEVSVEKVQTVDKKTV